MDVKKIKTIIEGTQAVKKIQLILFTYSPVMEKMQFSSKKWECLIFCYDENSQSI